MSIQNVVGSYARNPTKIYKNILFRHFVKPSKQKHVFVLGAPRSGTTLIQSVIMANDCIASFDQETGFFMYRDLFSSSLDIPDDKFLDMYLTANDIVSLFDKIASFKIKKENGLIFLEKTPQHVFFIKKLVKYFPNSKFINITRDCRDSYLSAKNFSQIAQGKELKKFLKYWKKCINARKEVESKNIIDIKYEFFVNNPSKCTQEIMRFIGVEYSENQIEPAFFSKNKRSGKDGFEKLIKPIDSSSVGRWKNELSNNENFFIESFARSELSELGYLNEN